MAQTSLLKPQTCFLHVIDVQESLMKQIHNVEKVIATIKLMIRCARILEVPILANTQYKKGLGLYVPELEMEMEGIERPDKVEFSCFGSSETVTLIDKLAPSVTNMLITGVETHICVYQTAMHALERGFTPYIVSDAVSSRHLEHHQAGLQRLANAGCVIGPAEMFIYELLGKAGTEQFKNVLPLIVEQG